MTTFYFIRHGQINSDEAGSKFYKEFGYNMLTLSNKGILQIKEISKDRKLSDAEIIITSPFGRAMHSAAILSKELAVELHVETELHEWLADCVNYNYLSDEEASKAYYELNSNHGQHIIGKTCNWESAEQMKKRVLNILNKYEEYEKVIVVCHGTLMQYFLEIEHPKNGQIEEFIYF